MNDTAPEVDILLHKLNRSKSGEERLMMGCSMFDFAKEIVVSSIKQKDPAIDDKNLKIKLFNRLYSNDFDKKTILKIQKHLNKSC